MAWPGLSASHDLYKIYQVLSLYILSWSSNKASILRWNISGRLNDIQTENRHRPLVSVNVSSTVNMSGQHGDVRFVLFLMNIDMIRLI